MLKISIVMLTTAMFAGLLIANPYGSPMAGAARRATVVAENVQTAPGSPQPSQTQAQPVVQEDGRIVQQATSVAAVVNAEPDAPAFAVAPTRLRSSDAFQQRQYRYIHTAGRTDVVHHVRRHG